MRSGEKAYFDRIAGNFDAEFNVYFKPAGALRVQRRIDLFEYYCNLRPGLKILEIGCGTGEYSKALLGLGLSLLATDLSYNMLNIAKEKIAGNEGASLFVSDIDHIPAREQSLDLVLGNSILHHLDVDNALKEIFRVLKKGGRLAFSEPNMLNPYIFLQKKIKFIKKLTGDSPHETAFYRWKLKKILKKNGFKNPVIKPFDFLYPYTPSALVKIVNKAGFFLEKTFLKEIAGSLFITAEK